MSKRVRLRSDVAKTLRQAFPEGIIEQPHDEENSESEDLYTKVRRRVMRLREARIAYERGLRAEPVWPKGADRDEDPPAYREFDLSYRVIFVTGPGPRMNFDEEIETIERLPWDDEPEDAAETTDWTPVRGTVTAGCTLALSAVGPFALVDYGTWKTYEDGSGSDPEALEPGEAAHETRYLQEQLGSGRWRELETLRARLVRTVEAGGFTVLTPEELRQHIPFLRFGEDVIPDKTVTVRSALFFRSIT